MSKEAARGVPDAIHFTDNNESDEYITGWNDCRAAMLVELERMQQGIDTLHNMYEQACRQRDELMDQQRAQVAAMRGRIQ